MRGKNYINKIQKTRMTKDNLWNACFFIGLFTRTAERRKIENGFDSI
jgi:hypothetical protein